MTLSAKRLIKGEFTYKELNFYLVSILFLYWSLLGAARLKFPSDGNYSMMTHTISYLGAWDQNPEYWFLFSIAQIFFSASWVPIFRFLKNHLGKIKPMSVKIGTSIYYISLLASFLVGLLPDVHDDYFYRNLTWGEVHITAAYFVFFGIMAGNFAYGGFELRFPFFLSAQLRKYKYLIIPYIYFVIVACCLIISQFIAKSQGMIFPAPGFYSFPLWEWNLMISTLFFLSTLTYYVNREFNINSK